MADQTKQINDALNGLSKATQDVEKRDIERLADATKRIDALESRFECCKTALIEICKAMPKYYVRRQPSSTLESTPTEPLLDIIARCFPNEPDIEGL